MKVKHMIGVEKPRLSILILSSGRKTIYKCLVSLGEIITAFKTEVVIVDTSKEHDAFIADTIRAYGDKIVDFEWCDDFSAARNAGLSQATGEWVLIIDDDEYVTDSAEIIKFLNSQKRKNYSHCHIRIRNFLNLEKTEYSDAWVTRLYKREPKSHFVGAIHERFKPLEGKSIALDAKFEHTGYIFATQEENERHSMRNIRLLKQELKKEPKNTRNWAQIVQEYGAMGDFDTQRRLCEKYIKKSKQIRITDKNERYVKNLQGLFIGCRIRIEVLQEDWQEACDIFDAFAEFGGFGVVADGFIALMGAIISNNIKNYTKAAIFFDIWMRKCAEYQENPLKYAEDEVYYLGETFNADSMKLMRAIAANLLRTL